MRHIELGRAPARLRVSLAALISGAALALFGCGSETPDASPADTSAPEEVAEPKGLEGQFAVASANPHATEAGAAMLAKGGSAVDAAIAVQLVLTLVEPQASGVGGGAFMLHYDSADGELTSYDGRETAPASATPDQFLDENGAPLSFFDAVIGGKSVGVPGVVALLAKAHARHGALPWADVFQPAIELAENGFEVSERLNFMITRIPRLDVDPATK
ncbi:MAG: gamma-glutamyltransferase, partial [Pseudomonadota bacterium]